MTSISATRDIKNRQLPEVSLSTMWAKGRFARMDEFATKARQLGFTHIEANASVSPQLLSELIATDVPISSIHCPCPAAPSSDGRPASDLSLSSLDETERTEAVTFAQRTIDLAASTNARAVVLHMGEVAIEPGLEGELRRLLLRSGSRTEKYEKVRERVVSQRTSRAAPYLDAAKRSLCELSQYGNDRGIILGLETRFHIHEIPNMRETGELLDEVPAGTAGYWHDVGHAVVQECLGFGSHEQWLAQFGNRMVGIHLHDALGISDHHAPGRGHVDWDMVARHLPAEAIRVCEIGEWNDEDSMCGVITFLQNKGVLS